jgi:hypothetical protein
VVDRSGGTVRGDARVGEKALKRGWEKADLERQGNVGKEWSRWLFLEIWGLSLLARCSDF